MALTSLMHPRSQEISKETVASMSKKLACPLCNQGRSPRSHLGSAYHPERFKGQSKVETCPNPFKMASKLEKSFIDDEEWAIIDQRSEFKSTKYLQEFVEPLCTAFLAVIGKYEYANLIQSVENLDENSECEDNSFIHLNTESGGTGVGLLPLIDDSLRLVCMGLDASNILTLEYKSNLRLVTVHVWVGDDAESCELDVDTGMYQLYRD